MSKADQSWQRDVDLRIVAKCEQHERDGKRVEFVPRIRTHAAAPRTHVTPEDWGAGYLKEPREREMPPQLVADLHECSPQALLRDLHRLVMTVMWHQLEPIEGTARQPFAGLATARQLRMVSTVPPRVEPAVRAVIEYQRWRVGMMTERWQAPLPDDAPRRHTPQIPVFSGS